MTYPEAGGSTETGAQVIAVEGEDVILSSFLTTIVSEEVLEETKRMFGPRTAAKADKYERKATRRPFDSD